MDLRSWLTEELDDVTARLDGQVLALVPPERRLQRPGGGNSILWSTFHLARHADLALAALTGGDPARLGGDGLGEPEELWIEALAPMDVDAYVRRTMSGARAFIAATAVDAFDQIPDAESTLQRAGVPRERFGWLFDQWRGQPASFFLRWPVLGHATSHIGEMIATRNRLGLSPH